jgi:DNA-binding response OmpR family regulator
VTSEAEGYPRSDPPPPGERQEYVVLGPLDELAMGAVRELFEESGWLVRAAKTEQDILQAAALPRTRCIVLPNGRDFDAEAACRKLRVVRVVAPILVLASPETTPPYEELLVAGADHVLSTGDWSRIALHLRVMIRDARGETRRMRCGPITVDGKSRKATIAGVWLDLSQSEFDLLFLLCRHARSPISIEELGAELLGRNPGRLDRKALVQRVIRLRRKLGPWGHLIESRRGAYRLRSGEASDGSPDGTLLP